MTIEIDPELGKLLDQKVSTGEFADRQSVLESALRALFADPSSILPAEDAVRRWDDLMAEVDLDPPSGAPPLSDKALSRESIYDDDRHRI